MKRFYSRKGPASTPKQGNLIPAFTRHVWASYLSRLLTPWAFALASDPLNPGKKMSSLGNTPPLGSFYPLAQRYRTAGRWGELEPFFPLSFSPGVVVTVPGRRTSPMADYSHARRLAPSQFQQLATSVLPVLHLCCPCQRAVGHFKVLEVSISS